MRLSITTFCIFSMWLFMIFDITRLVLEKPARRRAELLDSDKARDLSINLGGGECLWTPAKPRTEERRKYFGTLLAAYPGSGMRLLWQHAEGLTEIKVGDDYNLHPGYEERAGIIKTQYPHLEGIWSWGDKMDQVVLMVRNPRWALPAYHDLLAEIHYAYEWEVVYQYVSSTFTKRSDVTIWKQWRDYRFSEEMKLYKYYINYWMEGGEQYWMDLDFERIGVGPFSWVPEGERKTDKHCIYDLDCTPKLIIDYDNLRNPETGISEANKFAELLSGKLGIRVIEEEARECIWHQTNEVMGIPEEHREGPDSSHYDFTYDQLIEMKDMLEELQTKYSTGKWATSPVAKDLSVLFGRYIEEIIPEIEEYEAISAPTAAPHPMYQIELKKWYDQLGRGDRYNEESMRKREIWPLVKYLYDQWK